jgi:transposase
VSHVGIDLHKTQSQICVLLEDGRRHQQRIATRPDRFRAVLGAHRGSPVLLEASTESEWVARCLEEDGHTVIVADPNYAPMYGGCRRRTKTDQRDALALAEACRNGIFHRVHRVSEPNRQLRMDLTVREALVRQRTSHLALVQSLARAEGYRIRSGDSRTFERRVSDAGVSGTLMVRIGPLLAMVRALTAELAGVDAHLVREAAEHTTVRLLRSVPGIGPITALAYLVAIDDPHRFASGAEVASYLGLVPREWSSAERRFLGHIHKAGSTRTRWLLVEAAWRVMQGRTPGGEALREWTTRIAGRRGRFIAVVALARRLAVILHAVWRSETAYCSQRLGQRPTAVA